MSGRREAYCVELGPPRTAASTRIYLAMAIALRFGRRTPSVEELEAEFGMSRSTAYRWRNAMAAAQGIGRGSVLPVEHAISTAAGREPAHGQNSGNSDRDSSNGRA